MPDALTHLLVPSDFRPVSRAAIQLALEMAYGSQARVTLLNVIPEEPLEGLDAIGYLHRALHTHNSAGHFVSASQRSANRERLILSRLEREVHPEWRKAIEIQFAVRCGDVAAEVARFASQEAADMIVVGVHRPGWRLSFRPRVSDRIVRLADRKVALVHPAPAVRCRTATVQVQPA